MDDAPTRLLDEDFEDLPKTPEIQALLQYQRCVRRIVDGLPEKKQARHYIALDGSAFTMGMALKGLHNNQNRTDPGRADQDEWERDFGKRGVNLGRRVLWRLQDRDKGDQTEIGVALELIERVEPAFWRGASVLTGDPILPVDMRETCEHVDRMPVMIQVRNVPDELHRKIKARAALEGLSLSDYVLRELERAASYPTSEELLARIRALPPIEGVDAAEALREAREERERQMDEWS